MRAALLVFTLLTLAPTAVAIGSTTPGARIEALGLLPIEVAAGTPLALPAPIVLSPAGAPARDEARSTLRAVEPTLETHGAELDTDALVVSYSPQHETRKLALEAKADRPTREALAYALERTPATAAAPTLDAPPSAALSLELTTSPPHAPDAEGGSPPGSSAPARAAPEPTGAPATPGKSWPRGAVAAAAAAGLLALVLAPFLLYHRLRGANVLGHTTRARLAEMLQREPGMNPTDAARELGIDPSTALYHLRRMVKENVAVVEEMTGGPRYFAAGSVAPQDRARVVAAREGGALLGVLRESAGLSKSRLAERMAIARPTLTWHLERLHKAGLVRYEKHGREVLVFPAAASA